MGAADLDKVDVISECVRKLNDMKTYLKLKIKTHGGKPFIQGKLHEKGGGLSVCQKFMFLTFHIFI